jgi:hypothetical protein
VARLDQKVLLIQEILLVVPQVPILEVEVVVLVKVSIRVTLELVAPVVPES